MCSFSSLFCCLMKHFKHIKFLFYAYVCGCVSRCDVSPCASECVCTCVLPLVRLVVCRHVAVCLGLFCSATASCDLIVSPTHTHTHGHVQPHSLFYVGSRFMARHNLQHVDTLQDDAQCEGMRIARPKTVACF